MSGPHIKSSCGICGRYIKFIGVSAVPDYLESKTFIWQITNDISLIAEKKGKTKDFDKSDGPIHKNIMYNNLCMEIQKHFI